MKLTKEQEAEIIPIYKEWWHSYLNGDVKTYEHYLDDDYRFVGSTMAEDFLNKRDTTQFFDETADQLAGKTQKRNSKLTTEYYGGVVFITELADAYLLFGDEWTFYGKFRFSSMLRKKSDGWRFIYQHFSVPDSKTQEGETIGFEQVSKENQELRDAIKRRTAELENKNRELEIEAALERIRSASMAMQHSDQLNDISKVFHEQLLLLGIDSEFSYVWLPNEEKDEHLFWTTWEKKKNGKSQYRSRAITYPLDKSEPYTAACFKDWQSDTPVHEHYVPSDEINDFFTSWEELLEGAEKIKPEYFPDGIYYSEAFMKYGCFGIDIRRPLSEDEKRILHRFAKEFERTYTRFLDLQKAEAQAREAQVELALERVRSRSMAMHKPDELQDVVRVVAEELKKTGVILDTGGAVICTYFQDSRDVIHWTATDDPAHPSVPYLLPYFENELFDEAWESKSQGDDYFAKVFSYDVKNAFFSHAFEHSDYRQLPDDYKKIILESKSHGIAWAWAENSAIMIPSIQGDLPSEEEKKTLIRFAKVFEQSFIRFLDLQKAEEQAREAQIEASLERVRAKAMSMQSSDELDEVLSVLCEQFDVLGILPMSTHMTVFNFDNNTFTFRETGKYGDRSFGEQTVDLDAMDTWKDTVDKWKADKATDVNKLHFPKETLPEVWEVFHESFASMPEESRITPDDYPDGIYHTAGKHPFGYIGMNQIRPATQEEEKIVIKFANEFGRAYQRFLDLQKAEEQAREARIETALEKVRSRSMGMQSSEELPEAANLMFLEIQNLGINAWSCGYCILEEDRRSSMCITSSEGTIQKPFLLPHIGEESFEEWDDFVHSEETFFTQELKGNAIQSHYDFMLSLPQLKPIYQELKSAGLSLPTYQINHLCKFSHGFLLFITHEPVPEAHDIFKRFTAVFNQTYTRFLDLEKSEQRAREAEIDLALERIRAQVTAMQKSSDLFDIVVNMRKEFISLGHEADYFWHMRWLPDSYDMSMTSEDGNRIGMVIRVPKFVHDAIPGLAEWEKGAEPIYVMPLNAEEAWGYIDNMNTHGKYEQADPNAPTESNIREIGGLTFILARTSHGEIGYSLPGMVPNPPKDAIDTLMRLAGVFDLAYKRFEDLQESEQQARLILEERDRLEAALKELYATQDQLVQQEKLASLGQLTAGIAHEIKNPLNFVNNFSDLSVELIQEAREEIESVGAIHELPLQDVRDILNDIEANLKTIHKHGTRADGIVKSMLQHSRGGSGKMEPADLNALIKEYANLAFHGMRAGKDPINVDIELDLDKDVGEVHLIAEDFSRVILNLCTNAFDAMREKLSEKAKVKSEKYAPKLTVRTFLDETSVTIEIQDNGPGIPGEMKDKILQPFFTTKKGTAGTGLGLSITNDIVKAHGGHLDITTKPGQTVFTIKLKG